MGKTISLEGIVEKEEYPLIEKAWDWKRSIENDDNIVLDKVIRYFDTIQDRIKYFKKDNKEPPKQLYSFAGEFAEYIGSIFEKKGDRKNTIIWFNNAQYFRRRAERPADISYSADDCKKLLILTREIEWGYEAFKRYLMAANRFAEKGDNKMELYNLFYAINTGYAMYNIGRDNGKNIVDILKDSLELSDRFFLLERILDEKIFDKEKKILVYDNLSDFAFFLAKEFKKEGEIKLFIQNIKRELRYANKAYELSKSFHRSSIRTIKILNVIINGEYALYSNLNNIEHLNNVFKYGLERLELIKSNNYQNIDYENLKKQYQRTVSTGLKLSRRLKDIKYIDDIIGFLPDYIRVSKGDDKAYGYFLLSLCGEKGYYLSNDIDKKKEYLKIEIISSFECGNEYKGLGNSEKALKAYTKTLKAILNYYEINKTPNFKIKEIENIAKKEIEKL